MSSDSPVADGLPTPAKPRPRRSRWYLRIPIKWAIFALVTFFVLFPNPVQFGRHVSHVLHMEAMIDPDAPELEALERELIERRTRAEAAASRSARESASRGPPSTQRAIEGLIYERVKYEWDWNLWGSADYMPSVAEMFAKAREHGGQLREDCDGRAIMAASLMKRMGYEPALVTDLRHVWVETPEGRWMGPGDVSTATTTTQGVEIQWGTAASNFVIGLSYGIAVFPLGRELIILLTAFVLMLRRGGSARWAAGGLVLLVQGLLFMRLGYFAPAAVSREVSSWPSWVGLVHIAAGFAALWRAGRIKTGSCARGEA